MKAVFTTLLLLVVFQFVSAQENRNLKKNKLAAEGYDVVAYFGGDAKEGDDEITTTYNGAKYYFSSESNKGKFQENPDKYVPQYGGWCAYAMGIDGSKVKIDPETYKIIDNKLYLFYNFWGTNTKQLWNQKEPELQMSADQYWKKISG